MLVYFMVIWFILHPFDILYGHLVNSVVIWYIFPRFYTLYQEKSGNPAVACLGTLIIFGHEKNWVPSPLPLERELNTVA
jgi:hypothetical protein